MRLGVLSTLDHLHGEGISVDEDDSDPVTVYSRGEHGRTGLHHAARKGELYLE